MKWRFWQKAYLATLVLFLAALFGGVFGMAAVSWRQSFGAETDKAITRQQVLAEVIGNALDSVEDGHEWALPALYEAYGKNASTGAGAIELVENGNTLYSNLPPLTSKRDELSVQSGEVKWIVREIDKQAYLYVASVLPGHKIVLTRAQNISELFTHWRGTVWVYVASCILISAVFATLLLFILRSLSRPLERLTHGAQRIAAGAYDTRAPVKGKDDVAELSDSFNKMAGAVQKNMADLQEAIRQKQQLIDNLSHEIRTPVTAIQGYAEYAQQAATSPEQAHTLMGRIQGETARLKRIAERMLALSVMEHTKHNFKPVMMKTVFTQVLHSLERAAAERGVDLAFDLGSPDLSAPGDETLLESLVVNLAENAIKSCSGAGGGAVRVTAVKTAHEISITVTDNGHGMTPEELSHLGEAFYRADKSRSRKEGGAGLGVALCYEIVRIHGGTLAYASEVGKSTTASVRLPG